MDKAKAFSKYITLLMGYVGTMGAEVLSLLIILNLLGAAGMGHVVLFKGISLILFQAMVFWTSDAVVVYGREEYLKTRSLTSVFWVRCLFIMMTLPLVIGAIFIFRESITTYIGVSSSAIGYMAIYIIGVTVSDFLQAMFRALNDAKAYSASKLTEKIVVLMMLFGLWIFHVKMSPAQVIIVIALSPWISTVPCLALFKKVSIKQPVLSKKILRGMFDYSWPLIFGISGLLVLDWIDVFLLKHFLTVREIGIFQPLYRVVVALCAPMTIFVTHAVPYFVNYSVLEDRENIERYVSHTTTQLAFFWSMFTSILIIVSPFVVRVFIKSDLAPEIVETTQILLVGTAFFGIISIFNPLLSAYKIIGVSQIIVLVYASIKALSSYILIPILGIRGGAVSMVISFAGGALFFVMLTSKKFHFTNNKILFLPLIPVLTFCVVRNIVSSVYLCLAFLILLTFGTVLFRKAKLYDNEDKKILYHHNVPPFLRLIISQVMR